jgi:uncharacterized membrane protein (DUF2068 family)
MTTAAGPTPRPVGPSARREKGELGLVRVIGLYKLGKAVLMLVVAVTVLRLVHHDVADTVTRWAHRLHLDPSHLIVRHALARLANVRDKQLRLTGGLALGYAVLYAIQGIGLLMDRRWAEWLTVIEGLGLVPLEVYEMVRHPRMTLAVVLVANLAIVAFMYYRLREKAARRNGTTVPPPPPSPASAA